MLNYRNINIGFAVLLALLISLNLWQYTSVWYYVILVAVYVGIHTYGAMVISSGFFVSAICRGAGNTQAVAITFDDGPLPLKTDKILAILKTYNAPATFFCIGNRVDKHPELVAKIHADGHIVGNHTFNHGKFFDLKLPLQMSDELAQTDLVVKNAIGLKPRFFRPPYGVTNPSLAKAIRKGGYVAIGWSVRSLDTVSKDEDKLFDRVTRQLKAGDVILFHDYCDITIRILPRVLDHIAKLGLKIVRLDELIHEQAYA